MIHTYMLLSAQLDRKEIDEALKMHAINMLVSSLTDRIWVGEIRFGVLRMDYSYRCQEDIPLFTHLIKSWT